MADEPRSDDGQRLWPPAWRDIEATLADRDQRSADRDHADRLQAATERDAIASARDLAARARDLAGAARDRAMATLDETNAQEDTSRSATGVETMIRAGALRHRAAHYRALAAEHRAQAAGDRHAAATDREQAARDRIAALADRELLARQLAAVGIDMATGTRTRNGGLGDLRREIERCRRTSTPLAIAYVDVVGMIAGDDGDQLLIDVVACLRTHLRSYDHIIRMADDVFLCAMPSMTMAEAQARFGEVASARASAAENDPVRPGFAELAPSESTDELIARAQQDGVGTAVTPPSSRRTLVIGAWATRT
jgi:GGDEF domain-containing protein